MIFLTAFRIFAEYFPFVICVKGLRGVAFQKTICIDINKDATVIRRKRSSVMTKEAGSFDGVDNARGAYNVINLMGSIDMCRWWGIVLEHSVGVKKVVLMKNCCPLTRGVIFLV